MIELLRTISGAVSFSKNKCSGRKTKPLISWHFIECQKNLNDFLSDVNSSKNYCPELCEIINNKSPLRQDSLLGFFLRSNKIKKITKLKVFNLYHQHFYTRL